MKMVCKCGYIVEGDDLDALEDHFDVSTSCAELITGEAHLPIATLRDEANDTMAIVCMCGWQSELLPETDVGPALAQLTEHQADVA